jgi:hypothetical protein
MSINFKTTLGKIGSWTILRLPQSASAKLPSRGLVMVEGTINGVKFRNALEPDGYGSHWFRVDKALRQAIKAGVGDTVTVALAPSKTWPEPTMPADLQKALAASPQARALWERITPMARWDWIRWIGSTKQAETRKRHVEVACSKLIAGERRPCCFNRSVCTVQDVSRNGALLEPTTR